MNFGTAGRADPGARVPRISAAGPSNVPRDRGTMDGDFQTVFRHSQQVPVVFLPVRAWLCSAMGDADRVFGQ